MGGKDLSEGLARWEEFRQGWGNVCLGKGVEDWRGRCWKCCEMFVGGKE